MVRRLAVMAKVGAWSMALLWGTLLALAMLAVAVMAIAMWGSV